MKKYLGFLIFGILLMFLVGVFWEQINFIFRGKILNLNLENKIEFEPIINVTSEIPGLEILLSANFEETIKVWNKKLAVGENKKTITLRFILQI